MAIYWDNVNIGIFSWRGDGDIIRNNLVHHIRASGGNTCNGIRLSGSASGYGSNNSIYNNMVYDIQSTSTQSDSRVAGIEMQYQNSPKVYYNSVYLSGIGNGANPYGSASLAIWGTCSNVESKNNILVNVRNESPYIACSIFDEVTSNLTSDYNDLYYEPSTNSCLVRIGVATKYNTLASWQALGKDLNSITEMPHFAAPDLHINSSIATNIESHATPIAGITTDIDGNLRNTTKPDIGADEFNGLIVPSPLAAGTYSVGTTGYFPTIDSAFKKLSADGVSGAVTLELINTLYVAPPDTFGFLVMVQFLERNEQQSYYKTSSK